MAPAIYTSFVVEEGDDLDTKMRKLYLGMISCGEQAYTLGAAIAECRKKLEGLDQTCANIKTDFYTLKEERPKLTTYQCQCGCSFLVEGQVIGKEYLAGDTGKDSQ